VSCAALLHTKTTASKAPPPTRFIKYAMGDVGRLCLLVLSVSSTELLGFVGEFY
jgi:hypothetical protein